VLSRESALDNMTIEAELAPGQPADAESLARKAAEVRHHLKSLIGVTARAVIRQPGDLPRSQGKAVRIKDLRGKA
jgi:phenylacetate-CoA ligase